MEEKEGSERFYEEINIASPFLRKIIYQVDDFLCEQEEHIKELKDKVRTLREEQSKRLDRDLKESQEISANILRACLGIPSVSSIGPVGATIIAKIRDMQTIKEVKTYIKQIVEDNAEELKELRSRESDDSNLHPQLKKALKNKNRKE